MAAVLDSGPKLWWWSGCELITDYLWGCSPVSPSLPHTHAKQVPSLVVRHACLLWHDSLAWAYNPFAGTTGAHGTARTLTSSAIRPEVNFSFLSSLSVGSGALSLWPGLKSRAGKQLANACPLGHGSSRASIVVPTTPADPLPGSLSRWCLHR